LRVAVLAPMWNELAPLRDPLGLRRQEDAAGAFYTGAIGRTEVVALQAGIGPAAATRATERALALGAIERVVVVGIAGAVAPELPLGALVVPARVLDLASGAAFQPTPLGDEKAHGTLATSAGLLTDPALFSRLAREGVLAIDMETSAVAAVCERRGIPWSVFRALSDRAGDPQVGADVLALAGEDGSPNVPAVIRYVLTRPWKIPVLMRLGRDSARAARTAADAAVRAFQAV
jgi:adenosylhomocysteine nucleosidase